MQAAMHFAFAGNQAYLLAAVPIRDGAAKRLFDEATLPIVQQHGRGNDALGADCAGCMFFYVAGEEIQRMGVSKQEARLRAAKRTREDAHALLIKSDRVEIASAVDKEVAN